jgi:hypothetical protein
VAPGGALTIGPFQVYESTLTELSNARLAFVLRPL